MLLTDNFIANYANRPFPGTHFGEFIYLRTYSRWLDNANRRERWFETVRRAVEYSFSLYSGPKSEEQLKAEAEKLFDDIFNMRIFPAGRTLWIGGTKAANKYPSANFNCSFKIINDLSAFTEIFYLLLVGAGVGFRILPEDVAQLQYINPHIILTNKRYDPVLPEERRENTDIVVGNTIFEIVVGDSKEGWVEALRYYLDLITSKDVVEIIINYNNVRPKGEPLKTFGGRASGPEGLSNMFSKIHQIVQAASDGVLRPIDALDIANLIGEAVVVGGVRRTSEIGLFDINDEKVLNAKFDMWTPGTANYGKVWRSMSNNTVVFTQRPTIEQLTDIFHRIKNNGEPGFLNLEAAQKRRPNVAGINPCITGDTWVYTDQGEIQVKDLVGKPFNARINGNDYPSTDAGFFHTGFKSVYKLKTKEGFEVKLTKDHKVLTTNGWMEAESLEPGDKIIVNEYEPSTIRINNFGWLLGELVGDGTFGKYACLDFWGDNAEKMKDLALGFLDKKRSDATGTYNPNSDKWRIQSSWLTEFAQEYGITRNDKFNTEFVETETRDFVAGYIRGLFDSDGTVIGTPEKGVSVRLSSIHVELLQAVQRMLLRFGIYSRIYQNRRNEGIKLMPDGNGGLSGYMCHAIHELVISKDNLIKFIQHIGFYDQNKMEKLKEKLTQFSPYSTKFEATFIELEHVGYDDVYDCTIPEVSMFAANGLIVHNCAEILLDDRGVCNLTMVNVRSYVLENADGPYLDMDGLVAAIKSATRIGMRQTNVTLEMDLWDEVQKRDRLTGVSLSGWMDAMDLLGYKNLSQSILLEKLSHAANEESIIYAHEMRIPAPLLVTAIKPDGTLAQLPTVSSGLHRAFAPYYIRRVRITSTEPLAKIALDLGYPVYPENGTQFNGEILTADKFNQLTYDQQRQILDNVSTWVIEFPIKTDATIKSSDETAVEQFQRYLNFQKSYSDHNSSITITVGEDEWDDIIKVVYENWDDYVAVSFIPKAEGVYPLMPYESITQEEYNRRMEALPDSEFTFLLDMYERKNTEIEIYDPSCATGACPVK